MYVRCSWLPAYSIYNDIYFSTNTDYKCAAHSHCIAFELRSCMRSSRQKCHRAVCFAIQRRAPCAFVRPTNSVAFFRTVCHISKRTWCAIDGSIRRPRSFLSLLVFAFYLNTPSMRIVNSSLWILVVFHSCLFEYNIIRKMHLVKHARIKLTSIPPPHSTAHTHTQPHTQHRWCRWAI